MSNKQCREVRLRHVPSLLLTLQLMLPQLHPSRILPLKQFLSWQLVPLQLVPPQASVVP